ncbi:MAG TPA: HAD family phosphatase [Terriglobales bacterium]|nr:HAD family phosphatase [Terriglobales bacterium]
MIEGIIFDMDGVLIDSHPVHRHAWRKFLATVGKIVSDEELGFILEGRRRDEILRHFLGDLPASKIVEYSHQKDLFFQENFFDVRVIPGVREFLQKLESAKLKTAIATSASAVRTSGTLRRLQWEGKFSVVVTGDDVEAGKPDPAVYNLTSQRMNLPSDRLLAFEDAPCGIQAAKSAGIRCIGVSTNGRAEVLRRCGAELVIPDFCNRSLERLLELSSA